MRLNTYIVDKMAGADTRVKLTRDGDAIRSSIQTTGVFDPKILHIANQSTIFILAALQMTYISTGNISAWEQMQEFANREFENLQVGQTSIDIGDNGDGDYSEEDAGDADE